MKTFKKIVQLICTLLMALSLTATAMPVLAEGETITVKSYEKDKTYSAYQIFTGEVSSDKLIEIQWGSGVDQTKLANGITGIENIDGITSEESLTIYGALAKAEVLGGDFQKEDANGEKTQLTTAAEVADKLDNYTEADNAEKIAEFAKIISFYLSETSTDCNTETHSTESQDTETSTLYSHVISVDAPGYYFIKEKDTQTEGKTVSVTKSGYMMVQVLSGNKDIDTKSESPAMIKKVKEDSSKADSRYGNGYSDAADYSIGDMVTYRLYGSVVSDLTKYKTSEGKIRYTYEFVDMFGTNNGEPVFDAVNAGNIQIYLAKGANIDDSSTGATRYYQLVNQIMKLKNATGWTDLTSEQESSLYTLVNLDTKGNEIASGADTTVGGFKLSITKGPTDSEGEKKITDDDITSGLAYLLENGYRYVIVEYQVRLNKNAIVGIQGNTNTAHLVYSNDYYNNASYGTTPDDETIVFTYQLNGSKIDGETKKGVGGAVFNLYYVDSSNQKHFAKVTDERVTDWTTTEADAGKITASTASNLKGQFKIAGLDEGTYYLKEVTAPAGYNKLNDDIKFVVDSSFDNDLIQSYDGQNNNQIFTGLTIRVDDAEEAAAGNITAGTVEMTVANYQGVTLPSTGGEGISKMLYIAGALMVIITGVYLISKRRADALK